MPLRLAPLLRSPVARATPVALGLAIAGCQAVPTGAPEWDTQWAIATDPITFPVDSLLPGGLTGVPGDSLFELALVPATVHVSLDQLCPACRDPQDATAALPPFAATFGARIDLPAGVLGASLSGGTLTVHLANGLTFDPLRPGRGGEWGAITVAARSGGVLLGSERLDGRSDSLPPGATVARTLTIDSVPSGGIDVVVSLSTPGGDLVPAGTDERLTLTAIPSGMRGASAVLGASTLRIGSARTTVDLSGVSDIDRRIQSGALVFELTNPFAVEGELAAIVSARADTIARRLRVGLGESEVRLDLTGEELRSVLGEPTVEVAASGWVRVPSGRFVVVAGQALRVQGRLEIVYRLP